MFVSTKLIQLIKISDNCSSSLMAKANFGLKMSFFGVKTIECVRKKNIQVSYTWYKSLKSSKVKKRELISVITGLTDPNPFFAAEFLLNSYNDWMVWNCFWIRNTKLCQLWQNISKIEPVLQNRHVFGSFFVKIYLFFNLFYIKFIPSKRCKECNFRKDLIQLCKGDD